MKHMYLILAGAMLLPASIIAQQQKTMGKEVGKGEHIQSIAPSKGASSTDIFVEGFNDTSATGFPPAGWIMINRDGNPDPVDTAWYQSQTVGGVGGPGPYEGAAFAADYYGTANGFYIDDYLITPNTGGSPPPGSVDSLVFWLTARRSSSGDYPDSLEIRVSTTGRNPDDFTVLLDYVLAPKALWTRFAYQIPIAATRYIAFRYLIYDGGPAGANSDKVCLDDVRIARYPPSAVPQPGPVPECFVLNQNYPNPFNPVTTIRFQLRHGGQTVLTVYSALGEVITELLNEDLVAGTYNIPFDAGRLSSGVYYYRIVSGRFVDTRSMAVIK